MKGHWICYSATELRWIEAHRGLPRRDAHKAFNKRFRRRVAFDNFKALCTRKGWSTGRTGRFEKGIVPHNTGKRCPPGRGGNHPNAVRAQFKKGCRQGLAAKQYKSIGSERTTREGYIERKIHDGLPMQSRWRAVHLIRWEAKHGPIPKGHCLKCLDGDPRNTDPSNWEQIPRGALAILNRAHNSLHYDDAPAVLKPSVLAVAKLKHASSMRRRARA